VITSYRLHMRYNILSSWVIHQEIHNNQTWVYDLQNYHVMNQENSLWFSAFRRSESGQSKNLDFSLLSTRLFPPLNYQPTRYQHDGEGLHYNAYL
jgi:hypothetical protein